ncbi:MAG: hypothetical protein M1814_005595 [Vezdaea aestivalis]|nr:MAG: hypothetical protein M1814_005595 [Vezdaea aestivalis]
MPPADVNQAKRGAVTKRDVEVCRIFGHYLLGLAGDSILGRGDHDKIPEALKRASKAAGFQSVRTGRQKFREAFSRFCDVSLAAPGCDHLPKLNDGEEALGGLGVLRTGGKRKKTQANVGKEENRGDRKRAKGESLGEDVKEPNENGEQEGDTGREEGEDEGESQVEDEEDTEGGP